MKKIQKKDLCLAGILTAQILLLMFLTWKYGIQRLDGDDSGELILAEVLSREGGILSKNWYYSTELRVLQNQIVMSLLFRLLSDWRIVRTLGTGILTSILVLSYLFLCSRIPEGDKLRRWAPVVLLPFSYIYFDMVLYGLHYIPNISIVFFSLGLLLTKEGTRAGIDMVLLILLSFTAGLAGIRLPAVCYAPMFVAALFVYLVDHNKRKILMRSIAACAATGAGYLINVLVLSKQYTFMSHDYVRLTSPDPGMAKTVLINTIQVCGAARPSLSIHGIGGISGLLLFMCIVCMFAVTVKHHRQISAPLQFVILSFTVSWFISAFTAVFTTNGWANRYAMIPCMGLIPVVAEGISLCKEEWRKYLSTVIAGLFLVCSMSQINTFATQDKLKDVRPAYDYILNSGMTFGYSTWEVGDVLTEISDGRIHMCKIQNFVNLWRWNWLMEKDYMKYAEDGPVFLLLDKARFNYTDYSAGHFFGEWTEEDMTWTAEATIGYEDDNYVVWVFSSEEEFERITGSLPHE